MTQLAQQITILVKYTLEHFNIIRRNKL